MNYRHAYHAGNFADVFKHIILIELIQSLKNKEKGFCYLDTHAGIGQYDLHSESAQKTKEYKNGVAKIFHAKNPPEIIHTYLNCLHQFNPEKKLSYYPGSPDFARFLLRPQDRMILSELHPRDYQKLKTYYKNNKKIAVHHQDGWQSLKAFLPPKERRALILIDPPYENPSEMLMIPENLSAALNRFETGIFAIWYPMKTQISRNAFYRDIKNKIKNPLLFVELSIWPEQGASTLFGSGMLIVNPPWQFKEKLSIILPWVWKTLSQKNQGQWAIFS